MKVKVAWPCLNICGAMDYTEHGILQARIQEWVAYPFPREIFPTQGWNYVSRIAGGFFTC